MCEREKARRGRGSDKLTWGKWDVTSGEKETLNQCCQDFLQSETAVGDCREYYWWWAASLMTARQISGLICANCSNIFLLHISRFLLHTLVWKMEDADNFKQCKYAELDHKRHKMSSFFFLLLVKRLKKKQLEVLSFFQLWQKGRFKVKHLSCDRHLWISHCCCFVFAAVDTTKDPCQNVKCSRHKVCVAQGYQRAMCVNRKKLEHRYVSVSTDISVEMVSKGFQCQVGALLIILSNRVRVPWVRSDVLSAGRVMLSSD